MSSIIRGGLLTESQGWIFELCISLGRISTIKDQTDVERETCRALLSISEGIIGFFMRAEVAEFLGPHFNKFNHHAQAALHRLRSLRATIGPTNPLITKPSGNVSSLLLFAAMDILSCRDDYIENLHAVKEGDADVEAMAICEFMNDILNVLPFYQIQEGYIDELVDIHVTEMRNSILNKQGEIMGVKGTSV